MANIKFNNYTESPNNLICFTDIPNILKVTDTTGGTKAVISISINSGFYSATTEDGQWTITIMGETISNVLSPANAINRNFYIGSAATSTIASIVKALRNCPTIAANFNVEMLSVPNAYVVRLTARIEGEIGLNNAYTTNIPNDYITMSGTDGNSNSDLYGSKIDVDIYSDGAYITTLEKNFYNGEASFNISPVLTTFAEYDNPKPFEMKVSSISRDGNYELLDTIGTNYISVGYMCNQGNKCLTNDNLNVAQNFSRGSNKSVANNTLLYTYFPLIYVSFYNGGSYGLTVLIEYLDSAYNNIHTDSTVWRYRGSILGNLYLPLDEEYFADAFYVDITIGTTKIRYNVIKPIKAAEYAQRIYWKNSYGGTSFFDFTGQKTETRSLEVDTYQKNIFGYYEDGINELEKIYDNRVKYNVTLKSHLFENDGKYIFNDLIQSANVWTEINGENYAIIIESVSVDETDNNGIYEATVKYRYSQTPSLL